MGTWVALSVRCPTLGFGSGRRLLVPGFDPYSVLTVRCLLGILSFSPFLPAPSPLALSVSLSKLT